MLQRIQSIFIALGVVSAQLAIYTELFKVKFKTLLEGNEVEAALSYSGISNEVVANGSILTLEVTQHWFLPLVVVILCLVGVYTLLQFKNRPLQMRLLRILGLASLLTIGALFLATNWMVGEVTSAEQLIGVEYNGIGSIGLIISAVSYFVASRFVKKDEDLVKSIDRIR